MSDTTSAAPSVRIERRFAAPVELIWRMWTDPEAFAQWYGPPGARIWVAEMDVRVGGRRHLSMEMDTPNGPMQMWFAGEYRHVESPTRLVYTESMSDPDGNVVPAARMGMAPGHPDITEVTVELQRLGEHTGMTMTHAGVPSGSPGEHGWIAAFGKLETLLAAT